MATASFMHRLQAQPLASFSVPQRCIETVRIIGVHRQPAGPQPFRCCHAGPTTAAPTAARRAPVTSASAFSQASQSAASGTDSELPAAAYGQASVGCSCMCGPVVQSVSSTHPAVPCCLHCFQKVPPELQLTSIWEPLIDLVCSLRLLASFSTPSRATFWHAHAACTLSVQVISAEANFVRVNISHVESPMHSTPGTTSSSSSNGTSSPRSSEAAAPPVRQLLCTVRALLKKIGQRVLVGDNVRVQPIDWPAGRGVVDTVQPRSSELADPAVANVDHVLLLFGLTQPPVSVANAAVAAGCCLRYCQ